MIEPDNRDKPPRTRSLSRARVASLPSSLSLVRLRVVFSVAALGMLAAIASLGFVMKMQMDRVAKDREETIASRVFDELEREVSAFLDAETARDHYADLARTNPETWAPFVVGYFKVDPSSPGLAEPEVVAADGPTSENRRRVKWAIEQLKRRVASKSEKGPLPLLGRNRDAIAPGLDGKGAPSAMAVPFQDRPEPGSPAPKSESRAPESKIIDSLNRAPEQRSQKVAPRAAKQSASDPFSDYAERY